MKRPSDPARVTDAAALLPILGILLLMPPVIALFVTDGGFGGVPSIVVYLFGVWLALIVCAALLARRLAPGAQRETAEEDPGA
jgi:membrane protein implicated in regulation of membrane protease activity